MAAVYGHVGPFDENTEKFADNAGSVQLGNATVNVEADTGASRSTVSQHVYNT